MTETDLQLGGGYTYQWECAILLALNYFFEPVRYNATLFDLVQDFLGQVAEIHLEGEDRESGIDLEDINLINGDRRILIQVKTKQAEGERWTLTDPLLLKALYKFYDSRFFAEQPEDSHFVFLANRPFNPDLVKIKSAISEDTVDQCAEADRFCQYLDNYAQQEKGTSVNLDQFREMLAQTALVEYLGVDEVKANIQAKLQAYGRRDWEQAHAVLFEHFARQSTRIGGGIINQGSVREVLGPAVSQYVYTRSSGIPFQALPLPAHFVPRPEVSDELKAHLLTDETTAPGALVVSAVHGLGGIGKTTLVAHLAHDAEIRAHFPDGILWAILGQEPDVLSLLAGWIQALGDYDFRPTTVAIATSHLCTLLYDKACLLVVDDAWQADHARPFLAGGERSQMLITTRDATLARKMGARLYDLDVMTEVQALALFEMRLGPLDGHREQAAALARELGHLPLALELAAAQVESGIPWADLIDAFQQGLADLTALDLDEATFRNESLRLSFRLSLEHLSSEDQEAFAWLGVLPEDVRLSPMVAATLWEQAEAKTRKRLRRFREKALLKPIGGDHYTIHDLLHDEAKLRLAERMPLPDAHAALLARYRQKVPDERWDKLPDDGYIHEYLTWHLEQSGDDEAIHTLLCLETENGRNAWYEAREALGQAAGYLDDVHRAWRQTEKTGASAADVQVRQRAIGSQCRYALINASANSLAENLPPELIVRLVENDLWKSRQALDHARQMPDERRRAEALVGLAPHQLKEALVTIRKIRDGDNRAWALASLASRLAELGHLQKALTVAREIRQSFARAWALIGLVPHLTKGMQEQILEEALTVAKEIRDGDNYAWALASLASLLAELGHLQRAWDTAKEIQSDYAQARADALVNLAPHLPEELLGEALTIAREIWSDSDRAGALASLAQYLPKGLQEQVLEEALTVAREMELEPERAEALVSLASRLAELGHLQKALTVAREIRQSFARARALAGLASHLPKEMREQTLEEALTVAREIRDGDERAWALASLASLLAERGHLQRALDTAKEIQSDYAQARADALVNLAPHLPEELLGEALTIAKEIWSDSDRAGALASLAQYLPKGLQEQVLEEALTAAREIRDRNVCTRTLTSLAPYLPEGLLGKVLVAARETHDDNTRAWHLASLALYLPDGLREQTLEEALTVARKIRDGDDRAWILAGLAPHLPGLLGETLTAVREMESESKRAEALASLASRLAELGHTQKAWDIAKEIRQEYVLAWILADLSPYLPEELLGEALTIAREIWSDSDRVCALAGLASYLPEGLREQVLGEALTVAREIWSDSDRARALASLAPHLSKRLLLEALAAAREIRRASFRAEALASLTPHLLETEQQQILEETLLLAGSTNEEWARFRTLAALSPHLATLPILVLRQIWRKELHSLATRTRRDILFDIRALAPVIHKLGGEEAIAETFRAIQDVGRWWP